MPLLILLAVVVWLFFLRRGNATPLIAEETSRGGAANPSSLPADTFNPDSPAGQLDNLSQAIANLEGFGIPGTRPTRDNNPGDIKIAPGMIGRDAPGSAGIAQFADVGDGWDALDNWITGHITSNPDWDFYDLTHYYATGDTLGTPAAGEANPDSSAEYIADYLGVDPTQPVSTVLN